MPFNSLINFNMFNKESWVYLFSQLAAGLILATLEISLQTLFSSSFPVSFILLIHSWLNLSLIEINGNRCEPSSFCFLYFIISGTDSQLSCSCIWGLQTGCAYYSFKSCLQSFIFWGQVAEEGCIKLCTANSLWFCHFNIVNYKVFKCFHDRVWKS